MPTKNMAFLWLVIRHFARKAKYKITPPVVVLILGAITAFGVADYTSLKSALEQFIEDQDNESQRTFDDVIRDLSEKPKTVYA